MRKALLFVFFLGIGSIAKAGVETISAPVAKYAAPEAVSISTFAYTNVVSTTTRALEGLNQVVIDNPSTNSSTVHGHFGNCSSTSVSTSTVKGPIEIAPGSNGGEIELQDGTCIWFVSRNGASGAESVTVQGVKRGR